MRSTTMVAVRRLGQHVLHRCNCSRRSTDALEPDPNANDPAPAEDRFFKRPFSSQNSPRDTPRRTLEHLPTWLSGPATARRTLMAGDAAAQLLQHRAVAGAASHGSVQAEAVDVGAQRLLVVRVPGHALQAALALASVFSSRGTGPSAGTVPCPRSAPCSVSTFRPARGPKAMR